MSDPVAAFLARADVLVLDGALATLLEARGCDLSHPLWSARVLLERPDLVRQVHADYFAAGADCATTATYQATYQGLEREGLDRRAAERLLLAAVEFALEARRESLARRPAGARPEPLVAASIGSFGAYRADGSEFRGVSGMDPEDFTAFHRERFATLAASGADLLAFETIPQLDEALGLAALLEGAPETRAWLSFSCRDGASLCHGERIEDAVAAVEDCAGIVAVGINCTSPRHLPELLSRAAGRTSKPLVAYPNSGEAWRQGAWSGQAATPDEFAGEARAWRQAGARLIGGCCRTTPEHVRALAAAFG